MYYLFLTIHCNASSLELNTISAELKWYKTSKFQQIKYYFLPEIRVLKVSQGIRNLSIILANNTRS